MTIYENHFAGAEGAASGVLAGVASLPEQLLPEREQRGLS